MSLQEELIGLEERFWVAEGRSGLLRERLAGDAVMVFPAVGIVDEVGIIASLEEQPPWTSVEIRDAELVHLRDSAAVLTYRAQASGDGADEYSVYASSVWVEDDEGVWRLAFHQETPIG